MSGLVSSRWQIRECENVKANAEWHDYDSREPLRGGLDATHRVTGVHLL